MRKLKRIYWLTGIICIAVFGLIVIGSDSKLNLFGQTKKTEPKGPTTPTKPANTPTITKKAICDVAKFAVASVVNINVIMQGDRRERDEGERDGTGTGFIIDKKGYILTNAHVVSNQKTGKPCDIITVVLSDKKEIPAKIVGRDVKGDLAVLLLDNPPDDLKPVILGDSDKMEIGDWVVAIGNPYGIGTTVTSGIVSAWRDRDEGEDIVADTDTYIQTDAAINPGNSGGPLINLQGEVIGVNSRLFNPSGSSTFIGIGYAIPINRAKTIADVLIKEGNFYRPYLGINTSEITLRLARYYGYSDRNAFMSELKLKDSKGVFVTRVMANSPAAKTGLKEGDVVIELNGKTIEKPSDFKIASSKCKVGVETELKVIRTGEIQALKITPGKDSY